MSSLSNSVYAYYLAHLNELTPEKQFHFASRLYLWDQDKQCRQLLDGLRPWFTHNDQAAAAVKQAALAPTVFESRNVAQLRQPYFEKYSKLKMYNNILFRIAFLYTVYGIDERHLFHTLCSEAETAELFHSLLNDGVATSILSTHAINFLYLYELLIGGGESTIDPSWILEIGRSQYDLSNPLHLQLLIYLYTHSIIGMSLFYYRQIPDSNLAAYRLISDELERVIAEHFAEVNLDNKFELLACSQLTGRQSQHEERIFTEAEQSISTEGIYLVDRHNNNPNLGSMTLDRSEHRNALFIMANRPFKPLQTNR